MDAAPLLDTEEDLPAELQWAERLNALDALQTARRLSQGTLTLPDLRRMGHPYGHGRTPPQDPAIINRQSGLFASAWALNPNPDPEQGLFGVLINRAPYWPFLFGGTEKMIARPILERVEEEIAPRVEARRKKAVEKLLRDFMR